MENIGKRIRQIRKILNLSQKDLAEQLKLTKQAISNVENSKCSPSIFLLNKLLVEYDVNLNYIFSGTGEMFNTGNKLNKKLKKVLLGEVEKFLAQRGIK